MRSVCNSLHFKRKLLPGFCESRPVCALRALHALRRRPSGELPSSLSPRRLLLHKAPKFSDLNSPTVKVSEVLRRVAPAPDEGPGSHRRGAAQICVRRSVTLRIALHSQARLRGIQQRLLLCHNFRATGSAAWVVRQRRRGERSGRGEDHL